MFLAKYHETRHMQSFMQHPFFFLSKYGSSVGLAGPFRMGRQDILVIYGLLNRYGASAFCKAAFETGACGRSGDVG
jgi:hypothetical protein